MLFQKLAARPEETRDGGRHGRSLVAGCVAVALAVLAISSLLTVSKEDVGGAPVDAGIHASPGGLGDAAHGVPKMVVGSVPKSVENTRVGSDMLPGAPWTELEMTAIRSTLLRFYSGQRNDFEEMSCRALGNDTYPCQLERLEPNVIESCESPNITKTAGLVKLPCGKGMTQGAIPSAAKFFRLGFHDCFKYDDGTGGCDGCLNLDGAFTVKNIDEESSGKRRKAKLPYDFLTSSNANLAMTADILELIYTNHTYGYQVNMLTQSIKSTGKSRSDLWAFASQVAIEYFLQKNNYYCNRNDTEYLHLYKEPTLGLPHECKISPSRYMNFYSGRKDCPMSKKPVRDRYRQYQSIKKEVTPNPHGTGPETIEYFRSEFGFTPRETIAVMGAHSVGGFHSTNSGFRYTWLGFEMGQDTMLNNLYYRVMAFRPVYVKKDLEDIVVLKAQNQSVPGPSQPYFQMRPRYMCPGYGPVQWFMMLDPPKGSRLHRGTTHVTMLNSDFGFYLAFERAPGGYPLKGNSNTTCTMLNHKPNANFRKLYKEEVDADCLQKSTAGGDTPLYKIVEEYADNQNVWWDDFVNVIEKMLANGYAEGELYLQGPVRTTTTSTTPLPLEECTKNWCCLGKKKGDVCCDWKCGMCGGSNCKMAWGGEALCCDRSIKKAGRVCTDKADVGCMIPTADLVTLYG